MFEIARVIDAKFEEAERLFVISEAGKPLVSESAIGFGFLGNAAIGLDCAEGGDGNERYIVSRTDAFTQSPTLGKGMIGNQSDFEVTNFLLRFSRPAGDYRKLEDVPIDGQAGRIALIDGINNQVVEFEFADEVTTNFLNDDEIHGLVHQLRSLRVAERIQLH